ncbi:hypothetical protein KY328_04845 [Candidatus Woesearchaeota archaeon]|nr:hypothetical protein [Candidatus Woesearchaeota archaeon]MBW3022226.1 hypothetical protein [Candidatus Woesearchaeota archaeon]
MKRKLILFSIIAILCISSVYGIGLISYNDRDYRHVIWDPGFTRTYDFAVRNNLDRPIDALLYAEGHLNESFTFFPDTLHLNPGEVKPFKTTLKFTEEKPEPGEQIVLIFAEESPPNSEEATVTVHARVGTQIYVRVRYPGKYIETGIKARDVAVGETEQIDVTVYNYGSENLRDVYALVNVYDAEDNQIGTLRTEGIPIRYDDSGVLSARFDTADYDKGEYYARATVFYDGNSILTDDSYFKLGKLEMQIVNHSDKFQKGIIQKYNVSIKNDWNKPVRNVYAETLVMKNGLLIDKIKTLSYDVKAWETVALEGYWDLRNIEELGTYDFVITAHYEGLSTNKSSTVEVVKNLGLGSEKPLSMYLSIFSANTLLILLITALIIINMFLFIWLRNKEIKRK